MKIYIIEYEYQFRVEHYMPKETGLSYRTLETEEHAIKEIADMLTDKDREIKSICLVDTEKFKMFKVDIEISNKRFKLNVIENI